MFFHFATSGSGESQLVVHALAGTPRVQSFHGTIPTVVACPNCRYEVNVPQLQKRCALDEVFDELGEQMSI